jgi:hypothetical protein
MHKSSNSAGDTRLETGLLQLRDQRWIHGAAAASTNLSWLTWFAGGGKGIRANNERRESGITVQRCEIGVISHQQLGEWWQPVIQGFAQQRKCLVPSASFGND